MNNDQSVNMIGITLNDKEYQKLISELCDIKIKEIIDQKWYPKEIQDKKQEIQARYDFLKKMYSSDHKVPCPSCQGQGCPVCGGTGFSIN